MNAGGGAIHATPARGLRLMRLLLHGLYTRWRMIIVRKASYRTWSIDILSITDGCR
jgi:hypothetical protein